MKFSDFRNQNSGSNPSPQEPTNQHYPSDDHYAKLSQADPRMRPDEDEEEDDDQFYRLYWLFRIGCGLIAFLTVLWFGLDKGGGNKRKEPLREAGAKKRTKGILAKDPPKSLPKNPAKSLPLPVDPAAIPAEVNLRLDKVPSRKVTTVISQEWNPCVDPDLREFAEYIPQIKSLPFPPKLVADVEGNIFGYQSDQNGFKIFDFKANTTRWFNGSIPELALNRRQESKTISYLPDYDLIVVRNTVYSARNRTDFYLSMYGNMNGSCVHVLDGGHTIQALNRQNAIVEYRKTIASPQNLSRSYPEKERGLQVFNVENWNLTKRMVLHAKATWCLSPGRQFVFVHSPSFVESQSRVTVYKSATLEKVSETVLHQSPVGHDLICSSDGKLLVSRNIQGYDVWDLENGNLKFNKRFKSPVDRENFNRITEPLLFENGKYLSIDGNRIVHTLTGNVFASFQKAIHSKFGDLVFTYNNISDTSSNAFTIDMDSMNEISKPLENRTDPKPKFKLDLVVWGKNYKKPSDLDQKWARVVFEALLKKRLGWTIVDDPNLPLLQVRIRESDSIQSDSLTKSITVNMEIQSHPSGKCIWKKELAARSGKIDAPVNRHVLSRTDALVSVFWGLAIENPATAAVNQKLDPDQKIAMVKVSGTAKKPTRFKRTTVEFVDEEIDISSFAVTRTTKDEAPNNTDTAAETTKNAPTKNAPTKKAPNNSGKPKPLEQKVKSLPESLAWIGLGKKLGRVEDCQLHFSTSNKKPVLVYRALSGKSLSRKFAANTKDKTLNLPAGSNEFQTRPFSEQYVYLDKNHLVIANINNRKKHQIVLPENENSPRLAFSQSGKHFVVAMSNSDVRVYEFESLVQSDFLEDASELAKLNPEMAIESISISGNDRFLAIEGPADKSNKVWDLRSPEKPIALEHKPYKLDRITLDFAGDRVVGLSRLSESTNSITEYMIATGKTTDRSASNMVSVHFSPNGLYAAVNCTERIALFHAKDWTPLLNLTPKIKAKFASPSSIKWSDDSQFIGGATSSGDVFVWKIPAQ